MIDFSQTDPIPVVGEDAFFGELVAVESFDAAEWTTGPEDPLVSGGPESGYLSGSAVFVLNDGTRLDVRDGTPGGNDCMLLNPYEAGLEPVDASLGDEPCTIAGVLSDDGTVGWYATEKARSYDGERVYTLGVVGFQGPHLAVYSPVDQGPAYLAFRIREGVEWQYCDDAEFVTAMPLDGVYASSRGVPSISVDKESLEVVGISCL